MTTTSDPSVQPLTPPSDPPGDFTSTPIWQSPSTWLTLSTYLLPLFTLIFKDNAPAVVEAVVAIGPLLATVILVIQRNANHRQLVQANANLAQSRMQQTTELVKAQTAKYPPSGNDMGGILLSSEVLEAGDDRLDVIIGMLEAMKPQSGPPERQRRAVKQTRPRLPREK